MNAKNILVRTIAGKVLTFQLEHQDTIAVVKLKLSAITGIASKQQKLYVGGKLLSA